MFAGVVIMAKFLGVWTQVTHVVAERDDVPETMDVVATVTDTTLMKCSEWLFVSFI